MQGRADEKDTANSVEARVGRGDLVDSVDGRSSALRVALKDEAVVGVAAKGGIDTIEDIACACRAVLRESGGVNGRVDGAAADLREDLTVHSGEARRRTLGFSGTAGVDDGVCGAPGLALNESGDAVHLVGGDGRSDRADGG